MYNFIYYLFSFIFFMIFLVFIGAFCGLMMTIYVVNDHYYKTNNIYKINQNELVEQKYYKLYSFKFNSKKIRFEYNFEADYFK